MPHNPKRTRAALKVSAAIEPDQHGDLPSGEVVAYAFSTGGHLISSAPLDDSGAVALDVTLGVEPTGARILVGPKLEKPDLGELLRRGAVEAHARLELKELALVEIPITADIWSCWFLNTCTARGTVLKRSTHDGQPLDLPVCSAKVEIYEVDPIWIIIPRLPDIVIEQIREYVLTGPIPEPPEEIVGPLGPLVGARPGPGPAPHLHSAHAMAAMSEMPAAPMPAMADMSSAPVPASLTFAAKNANVDQLRRELVLHPDITRFVLCWIQPHWVTKTLLGTTTTDECGHFRFTFFRGCHNRDQPDLYFRVLQPFWIFEVPIYEPTPVSCYTHWNYACGTEVTIHTSSPFAQTCSPCPPLDPGVHDNYVAVMNIGNLLTSNIQGVAQTPAVPTTPDKRGLTISGQPFGGRLNPHLEFDPQLRERLGVQYYRVSVKRASDTSWRELDTECYRHYRHTIPGGQIVEPYVLGPNEIGGVPNLFEIPPSVAPKGVWSTPNAIEDMASAKWISTMEAPGVDDALTDRAGKFELKIELFTASGAPVNTAKLGIGWLVPRETTATGAAVLHLDPPAAGIVQGDAFVLPLHVDNNRCTARIDAPVLNGSVASDQCGVMRYNPPQSSAGSVVLPYVARHRNGFATHTFGVKRGTSSLTPPSTTGAVGGGSFAPTETVYDLLSRVPPRTPPLTAPCTIGAFLEELYVAATATDGWGSNLGYDAQYSRAFTLAPVDPTP